MNGWPEVGCSRSEPALCLPAIPICAFSKGKSQEKTAAGTWQPTSVPAVGYLGLRRRTPRAIRCQLRKKKLLKDTGERRLTKSD
jgi:hypothetical protein